MKCNVSENGLIGYGAWGGGRGGQRWWFWPQFRVISGQQRGKGGAHFNWPGDFFVLFWAQIPGHFGLAEGRGRCPLQLARKCCHNFCFIEEEKNARKF